jgi:DNA-binding MarR family transcriptional regulator
LNNEDASMQVLRQFRQIFNAVKTHFRQVESRAGLGGAQVWALGLIGETQGIGVTELARRMDVHQSTASNLVRALLDKELIATTKDDVDRRTVQLWTLPAGAQALRASPGPFEGVLPGALKSLDPSSQIGGNGTPDGMMSILRNGCPSGKPFVSSSSSSCRRSTKSSPRSCCKRRNA